jgi:P-type Mg2+ transporter
MNVPILFSSMRQPHPSAASSSEAEELFAVCRLDAAQCCERLKSSLDGLSADDAAARLKRYGLNLVTRERKPTIAEELWNRAKNPLNALLLTLATVSYFLNDIRAAVVIAAMVVLAITTAFVQEHRSNEAAARLRAMVKTTASVRRRGPSWSRATSCSCAPET